MDREEERTLFRQRYQPDWTLRAFRESVWLVEYFFDDPGPTDVEFNTVFDLVGDYWAEPREAVKRRLEDCSGFCLGRPYTKAEVEFLQQSGIRVETTEAEAGARHIYTGQRYYYFSDAALREEAAQWMSDQGAVLEWIERAR